MSHADRPLLNVPLTSFRNDQQAWSVLKKWSGVFTLEKGPDTWNELQFTAYASDTRDVRLKEVGSALHYILNTLENGDKVFSGASPACLGMDGYLNFVCKEGMGEEGPVCKLVALMREQGIAVKDDTFYSGAGGNGAADIPMRDYPMMPEESRSNFYQQVLRALLKKLEEKGITLDESHTHKLFAKVANVMVNHFHGAQLQGSLNSVVKSLAETKWFTRTMEIGQRALDVTQSQTMWDHGH